MRIRVATEEDLAQISELCKQLDDYHYRNDPDNFVKATKAQLNGKDALGRSIHDPEWLIAVAEDKGVIIGFIKACVFDVKLTFLLPKKYCDVNTIVVDHTFRKHGVGVALMEAVSSWASSQEVDRISLEVMEFNTEAMAFYEKLGFTTNSRYLTKDIV
ncbi:GNAT family N-acetyltransferase [Veronia nyctiphanis]|uniref:GNAT family N-acetyltransferase n=1 Tax=Veronia nyctiphanis TaxID=1278244 RepID=A0A4Q0YMU3_9GAMM|nr:GNAT family N-acetyltransferase [Veronia nyctiphanis]RXJ72217.1 GNAT family N-acetyltransferase [Veronia nyctiphanis]